jgi:hypothetical protein
VLRKADVTDQNGIGRLILKSEEEVSVMYINVVATKKGYSSALASRALRLYPYLSTNLSLSYHFGKRILGLQV